MTARFPLRALVIAPQPFFSPRGTPFSVYYRTSVLAELGVTVDLLTYGQGQDVDLPGVRIIRIPNFSWLGAIKTGPSALKLFLDGFMFLWSVGLLLRRRYDFVHAHEEVVFYCRYLKPLFRFKLLYDMHSSLPQQLDNFDFTKSKTIKGLFKHLEDSSLKAADAVITICPDLAEYVTDLLGDDPKHFLIENSIFEPVRLKDGGDKSVSAPTPVALPAGRKVVIYAGTFEKYQGLDLLIPAFAAVLKEVPQALLLMVGGDDQQVETMRNLAADCGITDDVIFTGRVPQQLAKHYNALADVLTSPRSAGTNTPLKVYEQLASGTPLVATRIYSHTQVLSEADTFLVEPNAADMARGIVAALTDSDAANARVAAAQALYKAEYSRPAYVAKMTRLLERLS
ncbi:MAG TPA: glycosyltransferase family 4 protein [Woeseiaceae bacterium]|nr:glycosyltransferase family 4 protein [Woeseiaceae bacterium]